MTAGARADVSPTSAVASAPALRPASSAPLSAEAIEHTIRHTTLRGVGFIGMLGIALIHLLDVLSKFEETPYLGVMYIALMVASLAVAALILHSGSTLAWGAAGCARRRHADRLRAQPHHRTSRRYGRHRQLV